MSDSAVPAATDENYSVIRTFQKNIHYYNRPGVETVYCQEREYAENNPKGQYQLWISNWISNKNVYMYVRNITSEMKERKKNIPLAWADTVSDLSEFDKSKKTRIASLLGRLQCLV